MLINRNVTIGARRTSLRLEPEFWDALADIAAREGLGIDEVCTLIDRQRGTLARTAAVRVYIVGYFNALVNRPRRTNTARPMAGYSDRLAAARAAPGS